MTRDARFEIVRTDAGHHARFVAANGKTVWTTEVYTRRRAAVEAIELLVGDAIVTSPFADHPEIWRRCSSDRPTEVRDIDERNDDQAAMRIDPEPPGVTFREFTDAEIAALDGDA